MNPPDPQQGNPGQTLASWKLQRLLFWVFVLTSPLLVAAGCNAIIWAGAATLPAP